MFKRNFIPITILIIISIFVLQPEVVSEGVSKGLSIWVNNIIPFLFPMSILSNILLQYNFLYRLLEKFSSLSYKIFKNKYAMIPYFISFISGYPSGALATNIMAHNRKISPKEANYLLLFTNNCSFQFIAGALAFSMLGNFNLYKYIAVPHFLGAIIFSFLFTNDDSHLIRKIHSNISHVPFNQVFSSSIYKSVTSMLSICGVIVIFSVFSQFIINIISSVDCCIFIGANLKDIIFSLVVGIFEITNGCSIISASPYLPVEIKLIIINFLVSFSGLSVTFQTMAVISDFNFDAGKYIIKKIIFGIISALLCTIMLIFFK